MAPGEPTESPVESTRSVDQRLAFAARQGAVVTVALLVLRAITERSRPDEAPPRDLLASPYLWAVVIWWLVLAVNAIAFERSRMNELEGMPLLGAVVVGALTFGVGLLRFDHGAVAERLVYLGLNGVGTVLFWWAMGSLALLLWRRTEH